jgi:hypothetical protein
MMRRGGRSRRADSCDVSILMRALFAVPGEGLSGEALSFAAASVASVRACLDAKVSYKTKAATAQTTV